MITETFDTYTRRTTAYHVSAGICVSIFVFMVIARIASFDASREVVFCLVLVEVAALLTVAYLTGTGKSYRKDGELTISADRIVIGSTVFDISRIIILKVFADDYKGKISKFPTDGGGNTIELHTDEIIYKSHFVIKSAAQAESLKQMIDQWKAAGVAVNP